jgi:hypothetical protein
MVTQDLSWKAVGAALAAVCGSLPFYVHFNQESFSPPTMAFSGIIADVVVAEDRISRFERLGESGKVTVVDRLSTGTTRPATSSPVAVPREQIAQPFPGDAIPLRLLSVSDNSALLVDGDLVQLVRVGTQLSNGASIRAIRVTVSGGEVILSNGSVLSASRK